MSLHDAHPCASSFADHIGREGTGVSVLGRSPGTLDETAWQLDPLAEKSLVAG